MAAYVSIECELSKWPQRMVFMRPDFSHIEDVPSVLLHLLSGHRLNISCPTREVALCDVLEQVLDIVIRVFASDLCGFCLGEVLDSLIGLHVNLDIDK